MAPEMIFALFVCIFLFAFVFEDESKVAVAPGAGG